MRTIFLNLIAALCMSCIVASCSQGSSSDKDGNVGLKATQTEKPLPSIGVEEQTPIEDVDVATKATSTGSHCTYTVGCNCPGFSGIQSKEVYKQSICKHCKHHKKYHK